MQKIVSHKHFNMSKQIGLMPSYWSIIINDDSQERIGVQETKV